MTAERMFRELGDVLEILTARDALILVLEDLHWSDTATLEFLAYIARRRDSARLLIVGTYRPLEVLHTNTGCVVSSPSLVRIRSVQSWCLTIFLASRSKPTFYSAAESYPG